MWVPVLHVLGFSYLHPQNMVQEPVNGFVQVEHEDKLHNQAQVPRFKHLSNEAQLGALPDQPVFLRLLESEVLPGTLVLAKVLSSSYR